MISQLTGFLEVQVCRGTKISFPPGCLLSPAHLDCTDYTNTGTRERIATYVAEFIYQALLHRTSCDEDHSFNSVSVF